MGRIVGIDLGTTYSAVAIPEERRDEGFQVIPACPGCSIILDQRKRRITPSVVAEDELGKIHVGYTAKARAGLTPEPITFSKRWMGKDKTFRLARQGTLTPVDVAAHILRYLKELAESRLKESVEEAVITVPAYFSLLAHQLTGKAGELAGLKVSQIAQEPVAAALMYCVKDTRDPLRIMTYDLGGGTFDVAILEKRDGVISSDSVRAFDGDPFLGGYEFDKSLVGWILNQLIDQGYDLHLNLEDPGDRIIFAKLMEAAERAKIDLSGREVVEIQLPNTNLKDHSGQPVAIQLEVERAQFEEMIRTQVEHSIRLCHRARTEKAKPALEPNQFDEILLVGGSSRIPMIARRLEEEFGKKPKLVEPDLCVALGAAILAGTKAKSYGCLKLDPIPAQTDLPTLQVAGRVVPGPDVPRAAGVAVSLQAQDGSYRVRKDTTAEGRFLFERVPLAPEATTHFVLTAAVDGREVARHQFATRRSAAAPATGGGLVEAATNLLSKPIKVVLLDGEHVLVPERTPLPHRVPLLKALTTDTSGTIRVPVLEDYHPLGEIVMTGLPASLPVGTEVEITLTIEENYQIRGRAVVPALKREQQVVIDLSQPRTPSLQELRGRLDDLERRAGDAVTSAGRAARFEKAGIVNQIRQRLRDAQEMFKDVSPDGAKINDCLEEVNGLIRALGAGWKPEPSRDVLEQRARRVSDLLTRLIRQKPEVARDGYDKRLAALRKDAEAAYTAQNSAAWAEACQKVNKLGDELEGQLEREGGGGGGGGGGDSAPQDPASLILGLSQNLAKLAKLAQDQGRYEPLKAEFKEAADSLKRIDHRAPDAMAQIRDWYFSRYEKLRERLDAPEEKGYLKLA